MVENNLYLNKKIKNLPDNLKDMVENVTEKENVFYSKPLKKGALVLKIFAGIFALLLLVSIVILTLSQIKSYPDYIFSLTVFPIVVLLLLLFVIFFFWQSLHGLCAHFKHEKFFMLVTPEFFVIRKNQKASFIPWSSITNYSSKRRETDNFVTSIKLLFKFKKGIKSFNIPDFFSNHFNKIQDYLSDYVVIEETKAEDVETKEVETKLKSWPIVLGLSIHNKMLPENILKFVKNKDGNDKTLYFESKKGYFWKIFAIVLSFVFLFGFTMSILELVGLTPFLGLGDISFNINFKVFLIVLFSVLAIGAMALIVISLVNIIKTQRQVLIVTMDGIIERVFDIVYVVPWASVKGITTKWFSYGHIHEKGELKIQITYSEKKEKANRTYNIQGNYLMDTHQLVDLLTKYWKGDNAKVSTKKKKPKNESKETVDEPKKK
ncbi:hypothetical protein HN695_07015 [Candidatus Woesearchaeota archaeon]|jgi:ABC-type multidrug transport system fused ATPase/permease subunit|nr:hypothetical protein [Candidatus Woesearchaeota archaeon]MBT5271889.1 hypothetical protein [Candidatus Woesearchaeota archaeon]MBT6040704.1 hypothetical protein [Candidatus Woesearchaeota archaeon]MBT6336177.1 hypothetical protein [Candidatus Woesearchaeota archaeon]MBT7928056.1 hypothetical protein [Candidatus Woesearchaeota archaeon]